LFEPDFYFPELAEKDNSIFEGATLEDFFYDCGFISCESDEESDVFGEHRIPPERRG
jgi:hypothetical protein